MTLGEKNGGSFSEMMGPSIYFPLHICILTTDYKYSKTCLKWPLKKEDQLCLNAGQTYCRMLQGEHSAILSTCIKLPFVLAA